MHGWLIYSKRDIKKNEKYIEFHITESKSLNINIQLIVLEDIEFGIQNDTHIIQYKHQKIKKPDFAICRTIYPMLSKHLEYMGVKVFNNSFVADICNDKAKTYQYVAQLGIRIVNSTFYKNDMVKSVMKSLSKRSVIKTVAGHGGSQVFLINPKDKGVSGICYEEQCEDIYKKLEGMDVVIQPLIGTKHEDLRVYVIGKQIIAAILRKAKDGFRSNFSLGGDVTEFNLSEEHIKIVNKIISLFDFGLVGIDFIIDDNGDLIFNEIEDVVGARMLYHCTDINLVRLYLEFIKEGM